MASAPLLVIVAGPNGSGKTTLIAALRTDPAVRLPALYVNADDLQRERRLADAADAQRLATGLRTRALQARSDVMYETVMSHPSKVAELQQARAAGYHVVVHLVATEDASVNTARVAARVAAGGHNVPPERIAARYARTLALAPLAIAQAHEAFVFDNSRSATVAQHPTLHAALQGSRLALATDAPAQWVQRLARQVDERAAEAQAFTRSVASRGLAWQPARLDDAATQGPIIALGKHYVLQYDESTRNAVLHEWVLLGALVNGLALQESRRLVYRDGVASVEPPQQARQR